MALTNPKIFGLKIGNKLTDVENKRLVLQNLGIPQSDLDVIRGASDEGGSRNDFINFSRLVQPIFRTLDRYYEDSKNYDSVVVDRASVSSILFGNLTINGRLDASSMRYRYLDGTTVKIADISTSRVSAWSSADPKASNANLDIQAEARISYGSKVSVISSANKSTLEFGNQVNNESGISGKPRLQTSQIPSAREFAAEIPTHKITVNLDGTDFQLYAMKGIPLIFEGNFRNTGGAGKSEIRVSTSGMGGIKPSWKVVEVDNPNAFFNFPDVLSGIKSILNFKSGGAKNRFINFYYRPDKIRNIYLRDLNIATLPVASLSALTTLNLENNDFKNMPDLIKFSPILRTLILRRNPLNNSEEPTERKLNNAILNKIPTVLKSLTMGSTFFGSINNGTQSASIIYDRFSQLTTLNLQRYGGLQFFHKDDVDPECHIPNIPDSCTYYNIYRNDFRAIHGSIPIASVNNASVNNKGRSVSSISAAGSGYSVASNLATTGGSGSGMTVDITAVDGGGGITGIKLKSIQDGYLVGEELTVVQSGSGGNGKVILGSTNNNRIYLFDDSGGAPSYSNFVSSVLDSDEKTISTCSKLQTLLISRNYNLTDESFSIDSAEIKTIKMTFTNLPIPDLRNKLKLEYYEANHCRNAGHIAYMEGGTEIYKLGNCTALKQIYISNSASLPTGTGSNPNGGLHGPFPTTFTNSNLEVLRLENTRMSGGTPDDGGSGDTIPNTLFAGFGDKLRDIRFTSSYFRVGPVGSQVFNFTPNLEILRIRSNKKLNGSLPNIGACGKLRYLDLYNNAFTGNVYSLTSNETLGSVLLHLNKLSGTIPGYNNLPVLTRLRLQQNNFTALEKFTLPKIIEFRAHINQIAGTIPSFADCPKLRFLTLYSNNFTSYTPGAIAENYNLRLFDVSQCQLNQVSLNNIVNDLYTNYQNSSGSRSVVTNLRNQQGGAEPGESVQPLIDFLAGKGWTILT